MIHAGIVGLGRWGQVLVKSVQNKSKLISFKKACTGQKSKALNFCNENAIKLQDTLSDLLIDETLDAIILATPHQQHRDQIIAVANAGKHVFVEKPFTLSKKDAEIALACCKKTNVICAIGHNRRFLPSMEELKKYIMSGDLGNILHVEAQFHSDGGLRYTPDNWRASENESPAGGMTGLGIHTIDALISLLGPISSLRAHSARQVIKVPIDDTTFYTLKFAKGFTGYVSTCFATSRDWRIQVLGDKGWAEMRGHEKLTIALRNKEEKIIQYDFHDIERAELEAFANAILEGSTYPIPYVDIIHATAILEAVVTSAKLNRQVKL